MDSRDKTLIAENEALYREVNERVHESDRKRVEGSPADLRWDFVCECGEETCRQPIRMTGAEYETLRANPVRFAVVPGHERPEVEYVVERNEHFVVIEKAPGEREIARRTDPNRGPGRG